MARGPLDDVFSILQPIAIYGGLGWLVLHKGADGMSVLDRLTRGIGQNAFVGAATAPAANSSDGPANGGSSRFNFSDQETAASYSEGSGMLSGHAGFGHVGPGGVYRVDLDTHDTGVLGFAGLVQPWQSADKQQVQINDDNDWTGYGVDFTVHVDRALFTGLEARFSIFTTDGVLAQQKIVGVNVGF